MKTHPYITEKLLMGRKESNQTKIIKLTDEVYRFLGYIQYCLFLHFFNLLYSDGFSHTYWYNNCGIAYCVI